MAEVAVGSIVEVPAGPGRPRAIMMRVARIAGDQVWCDRLGRKGKVEGPFPIANLKSDAKRGPLKFTF